MENELHWAAISARAQAEAEALYASIEHEPQSEKNPLDDLEGMLNFRFNLYHESIVTCLGIAHALQGNFDRAKAWQAHPRIASDFDNQVDIILARASAGDSSTLDELDKILAEEAMQPEGQLSDSPYSTRALAKMVTSSALEGVPASHFIESYGGDANKKAQLHRIYAQHATDPHLKSAAIESVLGFAADAASDPLKAAHVTLDIVGGEGFTAEDKSRAFEQFKLVWEGRLHAQQSKRPAISRAAWLYLEEYRAIGTEVEDAWLSSQIDETMLFNPAMELSERGYLTIGNGIVRGETADQSIKTIQRIHREQIDAAKHRSNNSREFFLDGGTPYDSKISQAARAYAAMGNFEGARVLIRELFQYEADQAAADEISGSSPDEAIQKLSTYDAMDDAEFEETASTVLRVLSHAKSIADIDTLQLDDTALFQPYIGLYAYSRRFELSRDPAHLETAKAYLAQIEDYNNPLFKLDRDYTLLNIFKIDAVAGEGLISTWEAAQKPHFDDDLRDAIYLRRQLAQEDDLESFKAMYANAGLIQNKLLRCSKLAGIAALGYEHITRTV